MLNITKNTLTERLRINVSPNIWATHDLIMLAHKINHHNYLSENLSSAPTITLTHYL